MDLRDCVVVLWRNVGPYHAARMRGAVEAFREIGVEVVGIELSDSEATRDWRTGGDGLGFELITLAKGTELNKRFGDRSKDFVRELDRLKPRCVAVAGYDRPEMRMGMKWARKNGAVSVLMSETKWDDRPRPWWKRKLMERLVRMADAGLVSGGASGEYLVSLGMPREMVFRQYGAVDNGYFEEAVDRVRGEGKGGRSYFVVCCRLIERRKNLKMLFRAYVAYRKWAGADAWDMVICGDGEDRAELEAYADEVCDGGVDFVGFAQVDELVKYYAGAGCFVHSAMNEAWGLVVNEAMASGLPVLVSRRCGCAADLVDEGENGYTFDPNDDEELAGMLGRVAEMGEDRRREMGRRSREIVGRYGCDRFGMGLRGAMEAGDRQVRARMGGDRAVSEGKEPIGLSEDRGHCDDVVGKLGEEGRVTG